MVSLGKGVSEGKTSETTRYVSKGLTRSRTDRLQVVRGVDPSPASGESAAAIAAAGSANVTALHGGGVEGTTALKAEPAAKLSPTEQLEHAQETHVHAKSLAAEKRAEAKAKGYEGEACGECGNFTLVRNGTCMKCDTCGSTTGCS